MDKVVKGLHWIKEIERTEAWSGRISFCADYSAVLIFVFGGGRDNASAISGRATISSCWACDVKIYQNVGRRLGVNPSVSSNIELPALDSNVLQHAARPYLDGRSDYLHTYQGDVTFGHREAAQMYLHSSPKRDRSCLISECGPTGCWIERATIDHY